MEDVCLVGKVVLVGGRDSVGQIGLVEKVGFVGDICWVGEAVLVGGRDLVGEDGLLGEVSIVREGVLV